MQHMIEYRTSVILTPKYVKKMSQDVTEKSEQWINWLRSIHNT